MRNNAPINFHVLVSGWTSVFSSLEYIPMSEVAGLDGKSMFSFVRNCQSEQTLFALSVSA